MPHNIYIVGTVPLADSEAVFTALATLGEPLKHMPDGETGPRTSWLAWLDRVFDAIPQLEPADELWRVHEQAHPQRRRKLKAGASVEDIRIAALPMGDFARDSYAVFRRLRDHGTIRPGTKFQVDFAPAHSAVRSHVVDALLPALEPVYNDAICREVGRIAAAIPHEDLAIQFDVASAVFAVLQRGDFAAHGPTKDEAAANFASILTALGNSVPTDVDLLFHFCYGDNNHRHSVEPKDMADMADMANRIGRAMRRPINLIHMPVPRGRDDDAYFAPLAALEGAPETEIALGLVHLTEGIEGIKRRMATARRHLPRFAVATECGFGRRDPATITDLLKLHAEAAALA